MPSDNPMTLAKLEHIQLDALRELANIGAGHAATALSEMTGRIVRIGVPTVSLAARDALTEIVGRRDTPLVLIKVRSTGDCEAGFVMVMTETSARDLSNMLLARRLEGTGWLDELGASALKEAGNVLGAAYLNAFSSLTGWTIPISIPQLVYSRSDWTSSLMCLDKVQCEYALCLDTSLMVEGAMLPMRGHLLLFPSMASVMGLLAAVGAGSTSA